MNFSGGTPAGTTRRRRRASWRAPACILQPHEQIPSRHAAKPGAAARPERVDGVPGPERFRGRCARRGRARTVERIRALAAELRYQANPHAASLKTRRSRSIGVLVPRLSDMVLATIYEGVDEAAAEHGYLTFVSNTQDQPDKQRKLIDMALARRVDGLILGDAHSGPDASPNPLLAELAARVPFVLVSRHADAHCAVTCDDIEGGRLAARHLLDMGHRRIAVMTGEPYASTGRDRTAGFLESAPRAAWTCPRAGAFPVPSIPMPAAASALAWAGPPHRHLRGQRLPGGGRDGRGARARAGSRPRRRHRGL